MNRKFALVAGLLLSSVSAGSLLAQTSATPKPGSNSMQRTPSASQTQVRQDSTSAKASTGRMAHHATWTKDQVKEAQLGLTKAGFYKGKATGAFNKQTRAAIRAYQKANKLPVTGRLNDDLLTRLHSA